MSLSTNRTVLIILAIVILINALLLFGVRLLPFIDLPNHLAEATIYKYAKPGTLLGQYYTSVPWYYPNTFHTVFCSLFPSVEFGNKTFYLLYVILLLASMYLIIKELKGNLWYGLLSILFIYSYNVTFGFSGFTIAIPATILLFYVILLDTKQERFLYKISAALLLVLLYLMHAQMALFGLMLYGAVMLYRHWGDFKTLLIKLMLVPLPVIAIVLAWWFNRAAAAPNEQSMLAFLLNYYKTAYFQELAERGRIIVFDNYTLWDGIPGLVLAVVIFSLIFLPLLYYKAWKQFSDKATLRSRLAYPLIFLLISAGCYFVLPPGLPGQAPLYERFTTVVLLAILIIGSILLQGIEARKLKYFVLASGLVYTSLWIEYFYDFNRENKDFAPAFFANIDNDAKLGGLIYDLTYRGRRTYMHYPNYFLVWNKGLATSKAIDYRFGVVTRGEKGKEIPYYHEWIGRTYKFYRSYDTTLNYLLVRGKAPVQSDSNLINKEIIRRAGAWQLYKNNRLPD